MSRVSSRLVTYRLDLVSSRDFRLVTGPTPPTRASCGTGKRKELRPLIYRVHTQALHTAVDYYYIPLPPPWAYSTESSKGDDVWKCEVTAEGGKCRACMGPGWKKIPLPTPGPPPLQFIDETASCRMAW